MHLLGLAARAQRDFAQATCHFATSLNLARKCEDKRLVANILNDMGAVAWRQSDFVKARQLYEESLGYYQSKQDAHGVALNFYDLGLVACWQGDLARARIFGKRSLAGYRQLADPFYIAQAISLLALVSLHENKLDEAQLLFEQALDCNRTLSAQRSIAITLLRLGHIERRQHITVAAKQMYGEATTLLRQIGDRLNLLYALEAWLYVSVDDNEFETAARLSGTVDAWRMQLGTPRPPIESLEFDHHIAIARTAVIDSLFKIAWAEGKELSLDQALDTIPSWQ